ncbi:heterokaryon incompatibility protein [Halenospora varia]|nr:heterokaryon incompatibility protein [Halenospora varia]
MSHPLANPANINQPNDSNQSLAPAGPTHALLPLPSASTHIRLIELYPPDEIVRWVPGAFVKFYSPLRCRTFSSPISALPSFKALSYAWGPNERTHSLFVSGRETKITPSLDEALRHLRNPTEIVSLWIDQICINQGDSDEKTKQVALMSSIYSHADQVLVWLGSAADGSDELMDIWAKIGQEARDWGLESYYTKENFVQLGRIVAKSDPGDQKTIEFHAMCEKAYPLFNSHILHAMTAWYKRPWFSRVWVVQESSLGCESIFVCGDKRVPMELVMLANQVFDFSGPLTLNMDTPPDIRKARISLFKVPTYVFSSIRQKRRHLDIGGGAGDSLYLLLQKLYVNNNMQATDPRDRIWGLLALANNSEKLGIKADYANFQLDLIYARTARAVIRGGDLDLLGLSQFPKPFTGMPSWVPDWRSNLQPSFCSVGPNDYSRPLFAASGDSQPAVLPVEDERVLGLEGFVVDEIEEVGSPWIEAVGNGSEFHHEPYLSYLSQIRLMYLLSAAKNNDIYESAQRREEALWRVPIGDIEQTELFDAQRASPSFASAYRDVLIDCEWFEQIRVQTVMGAKLARYRARMGEMRNKRPFLSRVGYLGMGPLMTRPGDVIVVLLGARVPYVLRPVGDRKFFLLGEAYCDGVMDGEILTRRTRELFILI